MDVGGDSSPDMESDLKRLGFKPQKEIIFTKLLPYADQIDKESVHMLAEIKANFGKSVMMREMKPSCGVWAARLSRYIKMYGLKFSKEDHLAFIHLMYELLTIPNLEPWLVSKFASVLTTLLKKKELISPAELSLPWRPLYDLLERITESSGGTLGMYRYFSSLDQTLDLLVNITRYYFPITATQEILDELRPKLCPFDNVTMCSTIETFERFIPIVFLPKTEHLGYELWLHEFMDVWEQCNNAPQWEDDMMWVMARLAGQNIGRIDWTPYLPVMYTRFQRSMNLPVAYKQMPSVKQHKMQTAPMALWIVSTLGGGNDSQKYLTKFMTAVESYFHPANFGRWLLKLKELLRKLPLYFVQRMHLERYKKLTWQQPVPDSKKLTEDDVTNFVESIKNVALQAMFSKLGSIEVSQAMQHLATLRPAIIIPLILERMYGNLETLTEPHKLTSAMQCVIAVARPMVDGAKNGYKEGPTHVVPLLLGVLPGIDPNDLRKCFVTFQFISTFSALITFVDSSNAADHWPNLTEEERTICLATADMEDFVLQFMDRCFTLVESSSLESTRLEQDSDKRSKLENMAEGALASTCTSLLTQTSLPIFMSALRKLFAFVTSRILETKVAGHFLATICRCFAKAHSAETLRMMLPHLCDSILNLTESPDIQKEDMLDNELLYHMLILSEVVDCRDGALMSYLPRLTDVLDRTMHLASREGFHLSGRILRSTLCALTVVIPQEYRSLPHGFDRPCSEYLPIKDWGQPGDVNQLNVRWKVPCEEEVQVVQLLINRYLTSELSLITKFIENKVSITREQLQCSLSIVTSMLNCKTLLPLWDEEPINHMDSCLKMVDFPMPMRYGIVTMPDGSNVRKTVADLMDRLQTKLLQSQEDDTKSFFSLITIWECLLLNRIGGRNSFEVHWKSYHMVKKILENKLVGGKQHLRALLIDRAALHHELMSDLSFECLTETHRRIMLNLLALATSHYSEVRARAQAKLSVAIEKFCYSYKVLVPQLLENLQQDSNKHHEQFKGSLYVLLGPKQNPLITRHDWSVLNTLWPAVVRAEPSEKLSVIRLLEALVEGVHKHFPTITINLEIPDRCIECAQQLWKSAPTPTSAMVSAADIEAGQAALLRTNKTNHEQYLQLLSSLMDAIEEGNLHWRFNSMAMCFLRDLVHPDLLYPARIVRCFLHSLIHDSLGLRKIAIRGVVFSLKQQKREHKKVSVDPLSFSNSLPTATLQPGDRADNRWVQYNSTSRPTTAEQWDQTRYLHKPYHGYYSWPKEVQCYAPSSEQPPLDRSVADMTPAQREVHVFFSDESNVAKLIEFLSLEEKKGKDKFNGFRFIMFKGLFRNHGDAYFHLFLPHLQRLVSDKQESNQRCAAEIIAGLIRGSKHWPFEKVSSMWDAVTPMIRSALSNMTVETMSDWGICFATAAEGRDPNRQHWLLELLMEDPLRDEASFIECGRLYTMQGAINQQEWRLQEIFTRLLEYFKPFLTHPFQNVRERLASVLVNIFDTDLILGNGNGTSSPHVAVFIKEEVLPKLAVLDNLGPKPLEVHKCEASDSVELSLIPDEVNEATEMMNQVQLVAVERDVAIRLLKTVCRWVTGSIGRTQYGARPEYFLLLPTVCLMASFEGDEELAKTCGAMLAALSQMLILPRHVPAALATLNDVSLSTSWSSRLVSLEFLQVFVFHNMATFLSQQRWVEQVSEIVLRLLADDWLEVREKASQVLSGLLHCDFLNATDQLLAKFKATSGTKLMHRRHLSKVPDAASIEMVRVRHSGVLGLCAFISAYPYDVPEFLPDVFSVLGAHLNDPQPIPSTIRKTLGDFKRTHHDNWQEHSLKFTEEQLCVLGDLTIPPSYYA